MDQEDDFVSDNMTVTEILLVHNLMHGQIKAFPLIRIGGKAKIFKALFSKKHRWYYT